MQCPACENPLTQMEAGGVTVDICKGGCGGIWFDNYEFKKFDEPHESEGEILLEIDHKPGIYDTESRHNCPKCSDITLSRHFMSVKRKVEIDECPQCGGIWLDAGELGQIRNLFNTEEERIEAAENYFTDVFDSDLLKVRQESEEKAAQAKRIANMFKFITPSYYIPGKQPGGAF
jgi:Zn-finger nucleic acid-binding protein